MAVVRICHLQRDSQSKPGRLPRYDQTVLMKIVGKQNHSEFELNPQLALERGKVLDAMLSTVLVPHPRCVWRLRHSQMNAVDLKRGLVQAATINKR